MAQLAPIAPALHCPTCQADVPADAVACAGCGLALSAWPAEAFAMSPPAAAVETAFTLQSWNIFVGGLIAALLLLSAERLGFVLQILGTLVHELGHAACNWAFGYPAVPALDFMYGGGITINMDRSGGLLLAIYLGLFGLGFWLRHNRLAVGLLAALAMLHAILAMTRAHLALILFMGHGTELLFAAIFLYRGMSGAACRYWIERPLYTTIGWYFVVFNVRFAFRLLASPVHRAQYAGAKGGGHWMDFSRLSIDFLLVDLAAVAAIYLGLCLLPVVGSLLLARYREVWRPALLRLRPAFPSLTFLWSTALTCPTVAWH